VEYAPIFIMTGGMNIAYMPVPVLISNTSLSHLRSGMESPSVRGKSGMVTATYLRIIGDWGQV
jgi:hypothetical protein